MFLLVFLQFSFDFPRISESDVLRRCSYDSIFSVYISYMFVSIGEAERAYQESEPPSIGSHEATSMHLASSQGFLIVSCSFVCGARFLCDRLQFLSNMVSGLDRYQYVAF